MKYQILTLICIVILSSCSSQKRIEVPLTQKNGYGFFFPNFGPIHLYPDDKQSVTGAPKDWNEIKFGYLDTNWFQSFYQDYLLGNIDQHEYERLQKKLDWEPDTLELSKEPLKTKIALALGKDSTGVVKMIVDRNNNLDLSDDEAFVPYKDWGGVLWYTKTDSVASSNSIDVSYERYIHDKKELVSVTILISYFRWMDKFMVSFRQYSEGVFKGEKIAVSSNNFAELSYERPKIALSNDSIKDGFRMSYEQVIEKNEMIEIKGKLYKNIGVNTNKNTLILERISAPKSELYSTQLGFKSFPFKGKDFMTETHISSDQLKGKYVLLVFWATWCGPCRGEIPELRNLYKKTDREKLEIVGIVGDSHSKDLKEVIEKDSITWPQILSTDSNNLKKTYGIQAYPTMFLINPEGVIITKNFGPSVEWKVLELLNKRTDK